MRRWLGALLVAGALVVLVLQTGRNPKTLP